MFASKSAEVMIFVVVNAPKMVLKQKVSLLEPICVVSSRFLPQFGRETAGIFDVTAGKIEKSPRNTETTESAFSGLPR